MPAYAPAGITGPGTFAAGPGQTEGRAGRTGTAVNREVAVAVRVSERSGASGLRR